ncbi:MAG: hypothetical protein ACI8Y4_003799 [Candidatus Poriferisodalaceae bacterium]
MPPTRSIPSPARARVPRLARLVLTPIGWVFATGHDSTKPTGPCTTQANAFAELDRDDEETAFGLDHPNTADGEWLPLVIPIRRGHYGTRPILYHAGVRTPWVSSSGKYLQIPLNPERWIERACEIISRDLTTDEWDRFVPGDELVRPACPCRECGRSDVEQSTSG